MLKRAYIQFKMKNFSQALETQQAALKMAESSKLQDISRAIKGHMQETLFSMRNQFIEKSQLKEAVQILK